MDSQNIPLPPMMQCACDAIVLNNEMIFRHFLRLGVLNPPNPNDDWYERIQDGDPYGVYANELCIYLDQYGFNNNSPMFLAAALGRQHFIQIMQEEFNFNIPVDLYTWASRSPRL